MSVNRIPDFERVFGISARIGKYSIRCPGYVARYQLDGDDVSRDAITVIYLFSRMVKNFRSTASGTCDFVAAFDDFKSFRGTVSVRKEEFFRSSFAIDLGRCRRGIEYHRNECLKATDFDSRHRLV